MLNPNRARREYSFRNLSALLVQGSEPAGMRCHRVVDVLCSYPAGEGYRASGGVGRTLRGTFRKCAVRIGRNDYPVR